MVGDALEQALGPLWELYRREDVRSIMVDGPDLVYVDDVGPVVHEAGVIFPSPAALRARIEELFALVGRTRETLGERADVRLADGTRVTAVFPPAALGGPVLFISKLPLANPSWDQLVGCGSIDAAGRELLQRILETQDSLVVAGNLGSGRTTLISVIADTLPPDRRVIVVEHVAELTLTRRRCVRLETTPAVGMSDLLDTATSLRPDWVVVGDVLAGETRAVLDLMAGGTPTIASLRARGVLNALDRLVELALPELPSLGLPEVRSMVVSAVRYVAYLELRADGERRIAELSAVDGYADGHFRLRHLYRFDEETGAFVMLAAGRDLLAAAAAV